MEFPPRRLGSRFQFAALVVSILRNAPLRQPSVLEIAASVAANPAPLLSTTIKGQLIGERVLNYEAERGVRTWTSPAKIARLLLMRRLPNPLCREYDRAD